MLPRVRPASTLLLTGLSAGALVLAGCGSNGDSTASQERDTSTDVPIKTCEQVTCEDSLDGAAYKLLLPEQWNGTLLLYSHGYRQAEAAPPDFETPSTAPEPAPGYSSGSTEIADALLAKGYALAGSAYATNGWAVSDGVKADEDLYQYFVDEVGTPNRVYVWGDSLGGLITQVVAEKHPEWVSGAAPLCGVLGGPTANVDLSLDVAYALKTFVNPDLKLSGFTSWDDAVKNWEETAALVVKAGGDVENGVPKILMTAALVDAPSQTKTYDGSTVESQVRGYAESVLTALGYATFGRYDIEQRYGGNPADNSTIDYSARVSEEERALIETVSTGATDKLLAELAAGDRVTADPAARQAFADSGTPTGTVQDPTITLHTKADPLVIVQNETLFGDRYQASGSGADLLQLYTVPPATYSETDGAPYGAGHCNFTPASRLAVIDLLDDWVKNGVYPGQAAVAAAMGEDSGYSPAFAPGPWPEPTVS